MRELSFQGILPSSMLDWPGRICTVLFLEGCNFRCPFCHNASLVGEGGARPGIAWGEVAAWLEEKRGWIDGVCITGGEPTLHAGLSRPDRRGPCPGLPGQTGHQRLPAGGPAGGWWGRGGSTTWPWTSRPPWASTRWPRAHPSPSRPSCGSIDIIKGSGVEHEFRCTVVPGLVDLADLRQIAQRLAGAGVLVLQQFRPAGTLDPSYDVVETLLRPAAAAVGREALAAAPHPGQGHPGQSTVSRRWHLDGSRRPLRGAQPVPAQP